MSAAVQIDDLASKDYKEIGLQARLAPTVGKGRHKRNKRILNDILGVGTLRKFQLRKAQQPAAIPLDEPRPRLLVAAANLFKKILFCLAYPAHRHIRITSFQPKIKNENSPILVYTSGRGSVVSVPGEKGPRLPDYPIHI
jgi:hypothetical protein